MVKYYTRACNFFTLGKFSKEKIKKKLAIPLHGNKLISFDSIEILTRKNIKRININIINKLQKKIKKSLLDIKNISKRKILRV